MQRFGEKLRVLRLRRGLSLRDLAVALGHPPSFNSYLSDVENGRRTPKLGFLLQLAAFFQVSMDQLTRDDLDLSAESGPAAGDDATM
ncbi:MAG: helix-turn-helix domain-containing protein [Roseiflexaceae bacterium]